MIQQIKKPPEYEYQAARVPVLNWFIIGSNNDWFHLTFGESPVALPTVAWLQAWIRVQMKSNQANMFNSYYKLLYRDNPDSSVL